MTRRVLLASPAAMLAPWARCLGAPNLAVIRVASPNLHRTVLVPVSSARVERDPRPHLVLAVPSWAPEPAAVDSPLWAFRASVAVGGDTFLKCKLASRSPVAGGLELRFALDGAVRLSGGSRERFRAAAGRGDL